MLFSSQAGIDCVSTWQHYFIVSKCTDTSHQPMLCTAPQTSIWADTLEIVQKINPTIRLLNSASVMAVKTIHPIQYYIQSNLLVPRTLLCVFDLQIALDTETFLLMSKLLQHPGKVFCDRWLASLSYWGKQTSLLGLKLIILIWPHQSQTLLNINWVSNVTFMANKSMC